MYGKDELQLCSVGGSARLGYLANTTSASLLYE